MPGRKAARVVKNLSTNARKARRKRVVPPRPQGGPHPSGESRADREQAYGRWVELMHKERPSTAEMDELKALTKKFKKVRPDRKRSTMQGTAPNLTDLPRPRRVPGGLPSLGKRR